MNVLDLIFLKFLFNEIANNTKRFPQNVTPLTPMQSIVNVHLEEKKYDFFELSFIF